MSRSTLTIIIGSVVVAFACSYAFFGDKGKPVAEGYAPQQVIGSTVVAERVPDANAKPKTELPKGGKVNRLAKLTVQASPVADAKTGVATCPPIDVDLTLIDMPDSTKRFAASSNGQIVKFIDIPVATAYVPTEKKWGVGVSYNTEKKSGIWVDHYSGSIVSGVALRKSENSNVVGEARLGFRF